MQVQVKQNGRIAKALVWLCCAAPCIGCSTDQSADTVPASDAAMPDAGHAEDAPNNSQDAQGTDHGGTGDTPQEDCPDGHVCGSGDTVACQGPVEFAADPQDDPLENAGLADVHFLLPRQVGRVPVVVDVGSGDALILFSCLGAGRRGKQAA